MEKLTEQPQVEKKRE